MMSVEQLIGKCGFYCGSCPDYNKGQCLGCMLAHKRGDCYTLDCVTDRDIEYCGQCDNFPCEHIMTNDKCTVLDKEWLQWKKHQHQK